jgi:hypothetical protein
MQPAGSTGRNRVVIDHLNCSYSVSKYHPSPERLSADLDRIVRTSLADSCGRALAHTLDAQDPSVWVIRDLEFTMALDPGSAREDEIGVAWGAQLAKAIVTLILRGPDGETVLRFSDRAAYVAAFLHDLAQGRAFDSWQYQSMASLRSLSRGAAAREALLREPGSVTAVLLALDAQNHLEGLLGILTEQDILRLVRAAGNSTGSGDGARASAGLLLAVWKAACLRPSGDTYVTAENLLRLLVRTAAVNGATWTERLVDVAGNLLGFFNIVRRIDHPENLVAALARGDVRAAAEAARHGDSRYLESLPFMESLAGGDADWLAEAVTNVTGHSAAMHGDDTEVRRYFTPFGGLLLLLPAMTEPEMMEMLTRSGVNVNVGVLALLMKCAGGRKALGVFDDLLLRRLAGVSPQMSTQEMVSALPRLSTAPETVSADPGYFSFVGTPFTVEKAVDFSWSAGADALLRRFASRLSGFERANPDYLCRNFFDCAAYVDVVRGTFAARLARPPLAVLLQMTGYDDVAVHLPWLEDTELKVSFERA